MYEAWKTGTATNLDSTRGYEADCSDSDASIADSHYEEMDHGVVEIHAVCEYYSVEKTEWMIDRVHS